MPGMFPRSRRGSSVPPVDRDTHAAATAAAVLAASGSRASLASAAAGAALRSRTTTPEPVGNLVTKRMARRGSVSSVGSGSFIGSGMRGGVARGGLQRTNSGGSMTERTFRSPSPGGIERGNGAVSPAHDAPPVPAIPSSITSRVHQRSSSLDPPQRVMSPTRGRGGRGVSVDRGGMATPVAPRPDKRLSNVAERDETDRLNNGNGSRNFSRPMSSQPGTPTTPPSATSTNGAKKYTHGTGSWFSQPSGSGDVSNARQQTGGPDGRKMKPAPIASTMVLPNAMSYESEDAVMIYDPNTRTFTAKPREKSKEPVPPSPTLPAAPALKPGMYDPSTRSIVPYQAAPAPGNSMPMKKQRPSIPPVETKLEPPPRNPARVSPSTSPSSPRAMGFLHKQPSVVREDPEAEDEAAESSSNLAPFASGHTIQTSAGPAKAYVAPSRQHQRSNSLDVPRQGVDGTTRGRHVSISPARSAHFSPSPVIEAIRHDPPPRSISPAKSALKHHPSPGSSVRSASPMANLSPAGPKAPASEISDITSNASEDGLTDLTARKEKKRARVSFDEQPHEIDAAGAVGAPRAISSASGIAGDRSPAVDEDMDKEFSKPRPALPSFGSVRRNRVASPEMPEKVTEMPPEREGTGISSDHAIAGILSNAGMREKKDAEVPLPPEVTSKDEAGYVSDGSEEDSAFRPDSTSTPAIPGIARPLQARKLSVDELEMPKTRDFAAVNTSRYVQSNVQDTEVPAINLQPPTPGDEVGKELGEEGGTESNPRPRKSYEFFNVPGSWADEHGDDKVVAASTAAPVQQTTSAEERVRRIMAQPLIEQSTPLGLTSEPSPPQPELVASTPSPATYRQPAPTLDVLDEETDDSGAFSDAAEDLSDLEDGGFGSLDAIVSSPSVPTTMDATASTAEVPDSPTAQQAAKKQQQLVHDAEENKDWTQATAYWSQLSKQQKRQIERDHMSDDEDLPPTSTVAQQTKKKVMPREPKASATSAATQPHAMPKTMRNKPTAAPAASENESHMRRSMRGNAPSSGPAPATPESEVHLRRSMRGNTGGAGSMQPTMRSGPQPRPQSEHYPQQQKDNAMARPKSSGGSVNSRLGPSGLPLPQSANRARTDSETSMPARGSQESSFPRPAGKAQPAPRMQPLTTSANAARGAGPTMRGAPAAPSGALTSKVQKQVTNDSDSESSFRKKRRASQSTVGSAGGRYSMKRSMRAGSIDSTTTEQRPTSPTPAAKRGGGAFSIRSLSPSGGGVFGKGKGEKLRESLRSGSVDAGAAGKRTTLRGNPPGPPARTMRAAPSAPAQSAMSKPRFRSRFVDSDEEDEGQPKRSMFRSRFADSDEEDEPASPPLRPVRGIPRRAGQDDGDSTDLDSGDDLDPEKSGARQKPMVPASADVEKAMEAARRKLGIPEVSTAPAQSTKEGTALGQGSLRKPAPEAIREEAEPVSPRPEMPSGEKKKRSFMGSFLRRNRSSQVGVPQLPQGSPTAGSPIVGPQASPMVNGQTQANTTPAASLPSSPSTGKLIRRSSNQPQMARGDSSFSTATVPSGPLKHKTSENWPLPPVPPIPASVKDDASRPTTSDGVIPEAIRLARTLRPEVGSRSQSGQVLSSSIRRESPAGRSVGFAPGSKEADGEAGGAEIYSRRTGKKKKFGMLRRAFGLYD
ncbi:hypothetical protein LTR53_013470 [Teratosphaeriaceae sp. CCFEE 6253]|nr:hypothetical protein LTR53_013470 [Teratosphaeriaceae sp. CCFEE 6253]